MQVQATMTDAAVGASRPRGLWGTLLAGWAVFTGLLPHVLHHVGPLAGAALLAGAGGQLLFAGIGFAAALPFLLRLRRRFRSWLAPAIALALMVVAFSFSTLVIGPAITGEGSSSGGAPGMSDHASHHSH